MNSELELLAYSNNLFSLKNKVAIITGASRGLGKAISAGFASVGANVILVSRSEDHLLKTHNEIRNAGFLSRYYPIDINNYSKVNEMIKESIMNLGKIDILVNCAGVAYGYESENYPEDKWDETYSTNLKAAFNMCKMVSRKMIKKGNGGSIINITSIAAVLASPNNPAYNASKGGLKMMTKALAADWGKYNIRVNNLGPGYFKTKINKISWNDKTMRKIRSERCLLNRWGSPNEIIGPAIFLASEASSFVTGQDLYVDGGFLSKSL